MAGAIEAPAKPRPKVAARAAAKIPLPNRSLLTPEVEPKCEDVKSATGGLKTASVEARHAADSSRASTGATAPPTASDAEGSLSLRIKLEYERECYRQAELRTRGRLNQLQESVGATIKAVEAQGR